MSWSTYKSLQRGHKIYTSDVHFLIKDKKYAKSLAVEILPILSTLHSDEQKAHELCLISDLENLMKTLATHDYRQQAMTPKKWYQYGPFINDLCTFLFTYFHIFKIMCSYTINHFPILM